MSPPTRRRWRPLILCLLLGLFTATVVAWALAAFVPFDMYPRHQTYGFVAGGRAWGIAERRVPGLRHLWWDELNETTMGPPPKRAAPTLIGLGDKPEPDPDYPRTPEGWVALHAGALAHRADLIKHDTPPTWGTFAGGRAPEPGLGAGTDHAFGWPLPCLWYQVAGVISGSTASATGLRGGILLTSPDTLEIRAYQFRALPLRVIWWGFAADAALFAAVCWLALFVPGACRRALRRRRGQCTRCGYDLKATPAGSPCPECGTERSPAPATI